MHTLQKLTVNDAFQLKDEDPIVVRPEDDFSQVIKEFAHHADIRGVFVVDAERRFSGVITRTDLLDWARVKLGAVLLNPFSDTDKTIRLISLIRASTVGDILRPETRRAAVLATDTLADALRTMIEADLFVLPVIDASRHIIGSLTLSELLDLASG